MDILSVEFLMITGVDINATDGVNGTALIHAIRKGHDKCVDLLLKAGADVNITGKYWNAALIQAVRNRDATRW